MILGSVSLSLVCTFYW